MHYIHARSRICRRTYIGDQTHKSVRIFARLEQTTGLKDDTMVLSVFAQKIADSLAYWIKRFPFLFFPFLSS
jgi:hypothetical protein